VQAADFLIKKEQNFAEKGLVNINLQTLLDETEALFLSTKKRAGR
jgi:hypothetical protein